ncbi:DNA-binding protein S1FA-like [Cannabis sativa]|uniref:DNA-binding protein S1FA-like n=1 Tax=Cannabis sativa TaxID=3483 RepID=UPI0029C9BBE7|nr:DNA-binding protein S1FA-like [Cannabis sativa]
MDDDIVMLDKLPPHLKPLLDTFIKDAKSEVKYSSRLVVLLIIVGLLVIFLVGNFILYKYAMKNLPPRKTKPKSKSKKKIKKERLLMQGE